MGRLKKGILGGFSGTVGTVVGGRWKGIDYMRSRPTVSKSKQSVAQLVQTARFAIASRFLNSMTDLLAVSFLISSDKMSGRNSALSYTLKNAVSGVYPDLQLDYSLALVARGSLLNTAALPVVADNAGGVQFQWNNNSGLGSARAEDKAVLVAYCEELNQCIYTIGGALREAGTGTLPLQLLRGKEVHTWLAFLSATKKDASLSVYTGSIVVS